MANTIKQKRGTSNPGASDLVVGELAINTTSGGVFTKTDGGSVVEVGSGGIDNTATGYIQLAVGTTEQRPSSPAAGMIRFNTTTSRFEGYDGSNWLNITDDLLELE